MTQLGRHLFTTLIFALCIVITCSAQERFKEKIRIERIAKVTHLSSTGVNIWVEVTNDSHLRLVAKSAEADILIDGRHTATISLREKVVIPRHKSSTVLIPLRFKSHSTFALAKLLRQIVRGENDSITVNYNAKAGIALYKKKFSGENIAVLKFLDKFAISKETLKELLNMM